MAKVLAVLKVYPRDVDVDLENVVSSLREVLPSRYELVRSEKVYVAFGLYILRLYVLMPEEVEGGTEELEGVLKGLEGVESVETELVTRADL